MSTATYTPTAFVQSLPESVQAEIAAQLTALGVTGDDFDNAMNSRLGDLSDTLAPDPYRAEMRRIDAAADLAAFDHDWS